MRALPVVVLAGAAVLALALLSPIAGSQEKSMEIVPNKEYDPSWMDIASMLSKVPAVKDSSLQVVPLGDGKQMTVALAQLGAHTRILGHIHKTHDEVAHLVAGSCKFKLGETVVDFEPGSVVLIPAGVPHGALAGDGGAVVVSCFAPQYKQEDRFRDRRGDP